METTGPVVKSCEHCGTSFDMPVGRGTRVKKFCSSTCKAKARNLKSQSKTEVFCEVCGGSRWLLHPHLAGSMCRPCAAELGSESASRKVGNSRAERFESSFLKSESGCWEWTGEKQPSGYGLFSVLDRRVGAHRWSYEHYVGPVPEGLELDHLCRNPPCVNPAHLEPVTHRENMRRTRGSHCGKGHEFTPENTYMASDQKRYCRQCRRENQRRRRGEKSKLS